MDKRKILVIDDEEGFTRLVKLNLEKTGRFEVRVENDALTSLQTARDFQPDLILLDIVMPGKDGGEVLAELQQDPVLKDVPVIFLTATVTLKGVEAQGGFIRDMPFLAKPVDPKTLVRRIEEELEHSGR